MEQFFQQQEAYIVIFPEVISISNEMTHVAHHLDPNYTTDYTNNYTTAVLYFIPEALVHASELSLPVNVQCIVLSERRQSGAE